MSLVHKYTAVRMGEFQSYPSAYTGTNNSLEGDMYQASLTKQQQTPVLYTNSSQGYGNQQPTPRRELNEQLSSNSNTSEQTPLLQGNNYRDTSHSSNDSFDNYMKCPTLKTYQKPIDLDKKLREKINEFKLNSKSPVGILYEIMALRLENVQYSLVTYTGEAHSPIFKYKVQTDDMCAYGTGSTKKEAKQNAASNILEKLDQFLRNKDITPNQTPTTSNQPNWRPTPSPLSPITSNQPNWRPTPSPLSPTTSKQPNWRATSSPLTPITSNQPNWTATFSHLTPITSNQLNWRPTPSPCTNTLNQTPTTLNQTPPTTLNQKPITSNLTSTTSNLTPTTSNLTPTTSNWRPTPSPWTKTTINQTPSISNWTPTTSNQAPTTLKWTPMASSLLNNPKKEGNIINKNSLLMKSEFNPIGFLQELCMARHWILPKYEFQEISNAYKVVCSVRVYKTEATGANKQTAKRQAAFSMCELVANSSLGEMINAVELTEPGDCDLYSGLAAMNLNNNNDDSELIKRRNIMSAAKSYIDIFFLKLKLSEKPFINKLKNDVFMYGFSSSDFLRTIGEQEGFNTNYVVVQSRVSRYQEIMVQLFIDYLPVCTHLGTGQTIEEAREAAAKGALIFIKTNLHE